MPPAKPSPAVVVEEPGLAKWGVIINVALCLLSGAVTLYLAMHITKDATEQMRSAYSTFDGIFKVTAGALGGLMAGQAAAVRAKG